MLLSLSKAARRLGDVSVRTVRRLIARGELAPCPVGRLVRVREDSVDAYIDRYSHSVHNPSSAEPVAWKGVDPCHLSAQGRPSGTRVIAMPKGDELDARLRLLDIMYLYGRLPFARTI